MLMEFIWSDEIRFDEDTLPGRSTSREEKVGMKPYLEQRKFVIHTKSEPLRTNLLYTTAASLIKEKV